ncbi:hypothetical protein EAH83_19935 [Variovorax ginsengisoli]|uniref:Uncharacterized protein n=1 Tax=Variovorax guangxiensis TaxID=1775474 RepID=A0A502DF07_9BURK|nr:hypothetical protein EAH83_19935 [Variovorax ginsengisoli]TPG23604.1 hypothetical protein EAH82_19600 [Variovorax guangxiensis]
MEAMRRQVLEKIRDSDALVSEAPGVQDHADRQRVSAWTNFALQNGFDNAVVREGVAHFTNARRSA